MHSPPLDYAVDDDPGSAVPTSSRTGDITLGIVFDRHAASLPVTETMIRDAWRRMESERGFVWGEAEREDGARPVPAAMIDAFGRTLRRLRPNA